MPRPRPADNQGTEVDPLRARFHSAVTDTSEVSCDLVLPQLRALWDPELGILRLSAGNGFSDAAAVELRLDAAEASRFVRELHLEYVTRARAWGARMAQVEPNGTSVGYQT